MRQDKLSTVEFVALLALITSLVAMSIDAMLPALSDIAFSLGATGLNDRQLVLSSLFLGLS
jgi:MFS transporter, DHA1 family, multidrug resistance protein